MRFVLLSHDSGLDHDSGRGHPERPERLGAVIEGVLSSGLEIVRREAPRAEKGVLALVHDEWYIDAIERFCAAGGGHLDGDTHVSAASWEAALRAAGAGVAAVEALEAGDGEAAFIATRPPGHHALPARAMGFCVFNNIAIVAAKLVAAERRVAIFDWDVHQGNGTQDLFYTDPRVLYISLHESPFYPGTGRLDERGVGTTVNMPLPAGTSGDVYHWLTEGLVVPSIEAFAPDWLLVSAGYDAHRSDPLARIHLESDDYGVLASLLSAAVAPPGRCSSSRVDTTWRLSPGPARRLFGDTPA